MPPGYAGLVGLSSEDLGPLGRGDHSGLERRPTMSITAGTFIGHKPFQVDDSLGPDSIIPGWPGVILRGIELFNTFAGPEAYGRYLNSQAPNVFAHVNYSYSTSTGETFINRVIIENESAQSIKVQVVIKPEGLDNVELPLTWIQPETRLIFPEGPERRTNGHANRLAAIEPSRETEVQINLYVLFNDPPMIRVISLWIPAEHSSRYQKPAPSGDHE
jgi:hypothetical protein